MEQEYFKLTTAVYGKVKVKVIRTYLQGNICQQVFGIKAFIHDDVSSIVMEAFHRHKLDGSGRLSGLTRAHLN